MAQRKRPSDPIQRAKMIGDILTGELPDDDGRDPEAVKRGQDGSKKGGKARADSLTPERRKEIADKAIKSRWDKEKSE